jgi:hypothetical protein
MKKIIFVLITFLVLVAIVDSVIHSRIVQSKALSVFKESLQKSGWDVNIESIKSAFPRLELKNVQIVAPDFEIRFGTLNTVFSFLSLIKGEIVFKDLRADQVSWNLRDGVSPLLRGTANTKRFKLMIEKFHVTNAALFDGFLSTAKGSFSIIENRSRVLNFHADAVVIPHNQHPFLARNWKVTGRFQRNPDSTWNFPRIRIESNIAALRANGDLTSKGKIRTSSIQIQSDYLTRFLANIEAKQGIKGIDFKAGWRIPYAEIYDEEVTNAQGEILANYADGKLEGTSSAKADFRNLAWRADSPLVWDHEGAFFPNIELTSQAFMAKGKLALAKEAHLHATFQSKQLHDIFPEFYGGVKGEIVWTPNTIHLDTILNDVHYGYWNADEVKIFSDIHDGKEGYIVGDIKVGHWKNLRLEEATFETFTEGENWPFSFSLNGQWQHPLQLDVNGTWNYSRKEIALNLQNVNGTFFNHPVVLSNPAQFLQTPKMTSLKNFSLEIADASIRADLQYTTEFGEANLTIRRLPIDFLSLNPLDVAVEGLFHLDLSVKEKDKEVQGKLRMSFEDLEMSMLGQLDPMNAEGNLEGVFNRNRLDVKGKLTVRDNPLSTIDLSIPIHLEMRPLHFELLYDKKISGHLFLNGPIEEFLDFFNLGTHRLEGNCKLDFSIENTMALPHLTGFCDFTDGFYQNYFTGTELQNINAQLIADHGPLVLKSFSSSDAQSKGTFTAQGQIELLPLDLFPFKFDVYFSRFNIATVDLMTTEGNGHLKIYGDLKHAIASGDIEIVESDVTVPTRIPKALPQLQVVYKNAIAPPYNFELPNQNPYPLFLDIAVDAPEGIFISGRGLESEWKGQFQVGGLQTDIVTKGKIELIQGTFTFSSRTFKLSEGSLTFSGVPDVEPTLNLSAEIQIKDVLVTAHLNGPLNDPKVTLESSPPLPLGTIMAYLLFGQDLTEISSLQALQLAGSVASLVGDSPGVIEETKKSLGLDRIQIITVPSSSIEGGETFGVQIGKYVSEGVLVSYSQTVENTAGNVSVEVEMKGNLSFILESEQTDMNKQGKFTLRWAKTY